jgi:plastocyanin
LSKLRLFFAALMVAALAVGATAAFAGTKTVKIGDDWFVKSDQTKTPVVKISKGSKAKFKWTGSDTHNVTLKSAPSGVTKSKFTFGDRSTGSKTTPKFTKPGTYKFVCTIHEEEGQKLTIKVKKPA